MNPNERLIIGLTVGYMLKVLKSGRDTSKFDEEFKAIRHGNYFDFVVKVGGKIPYMVTYNNGVVYQDTMMLRYDIDFAGLLKSGPSLKIFYQNCFNEHGKIIDPDISNEAYYNMAVFEIGLRMHANNKNLLVPEEKFVNVITKLCSHLGVSELDTERLQKGRIFINEIKHNNDSIYKRKFSTWQEGLAAFNTAFETFNRLGFNI